MTIRQLTSEQIARIGQTVSWIVYKLCGRRDRDLEQEVWVALLRDLHRFNPQRSQFTTWAGIKARYAVLDALRGSRSPHRKKRSRVKALEDLPGVSARLKARGRAPWEKAMLRDLERVLAYTRRERLAFRLLSEGFSAAMAARVVGVSPSRVHQMVARWRARARELEGSADE